MARTVMVDEVPALWERQQGESAKAFAAFCAYRDLPAERRSVREAYRAAGGQKVVRTGSGLKAPRTWRDWCGANAWQARAAAWDREQDRFAQAALIRRRAQSRLQRIAAGESALAMSLRALRDIEAQGGAAAIGAAVAARMLVDSTVQLRIEYGDEPAQRVEVAPERTPEESRARMDALLIKLGLKADVDESLIPPMGDRGAAEDED